jgi:hypothetical protein
VLAHKACRPSHRDCAAFKRIGHGLSSWDKT